MFDEKTGTPELTISEQTKWRTIKSGDMETALEIATAYRKAEMATKESVKGGRTESDMGSILMAVCKNGVDIPLEEIPVSNIFIKELPFKYKAGRLIRIFINSAILAKFAGKPKDRLISLNNLIKKPDDFRKVPPIVVTKIKDGRYVTLDGKNRSFLARKMDPNMTLLGYVVPFDFAYNQQILNEAVEFYQQYISKTR